MRKKGTITNINYDDTKVFFKKRAEKYNDENPYSVTMYQDNNKEIVIERNRREVETLYPLLNLGKDSKILDIACGIGRWADAIKNEVNEYCGIDFSEELIDIANSRNLKENYEFFVGGAQNVESVLRKNHKGKYNVILLIGSLMYLNDKDVSDMLSQVENICEQKAIICIREPVGVEERLTLKDFYSEELQDNYNAIYRTKTELEKLIKQTLLNKGFCIKESSPLFKEDGLNNRKETIQYYFLLER